MSKLSDCQIENMIRQCEATAAMHVARGRTILAFRSAAKAAEYRKELEARARGEAVQEPQKDHR